LSDDFAGCMAKVRRCVAGPLPNGFDLFAISDRSIFRD
jgi:hypothetical protein